MKKFKRLLTVLLCATLVIVSGLSTVTFSGCASEKRHIQNISKKVEKRYMTDEYEFTSFEVFPLYDENDKLSYFLVEFEPYGYLYIQLHTNLISRLFHSKYTRDCSLSEKWSRYTVKEGLTAISYGERQYFELDENGNSIEYKDSHYKVSNIKDERRYLLKAGYGYIPSVKRGDNYLNLISLQEWKFIPKDKMTAEDTKLAKSYAWEYVSFFIKPIGDL